MRKYIHTLLVLAAMWLLFSGYFKTMLLVLGFISCVLTTGLVFKLGVNDQYQTYPRFAVRALFSYIPWLAKEIIKSNLSVAYHIWHPRMPISPTISFVDPTQTTQVGLVTYANSITLTPGTLTIDVEERGIEVHSMTREIARDLSQSDMGSRVNKLESR